MNQVLVMPTAPAAAVQASPAPQRPPSRLWQAALWQLTIQMLGQARPRCNADHRFTIASGDSEAPTRNCNMITTILLAAAASSSASPSAQLMPVYMVLLHHPGKSCERCCNSVLVQSHTTVTRQTRTAQQDCKENTSSHNLLNRTAAERRFLYLRRLNAADHWQDKATPT
jgi:hypothetical protein